MSAVQLELPVIEHSTKVELLDFGLVDCLTDFFDNRKGYTRQEVSDCHQDRSNTSYGATPRSTREGLIAEAARTQLPGVRHLNIPKKFGAGVDKVDEAVQAVTSWEDGGCDEFFTFASDTEQGISSDGRDSGTRALVSALMWGDAGAKHAYVCNVVFLSEVNGRADSDDDFQDVGGGGGCGTRSSARQTLL